MSPVLAIEALVGTFTDVRLTAYVYEPDFQTTLDQIIERWFVIRVYFYYFEGGLRPVWICLFEADDGASVCMI